MKSLIILWFLSMITSDIVTAKVEVTSGIYLETLPNISFYQSTRQIIFKVRRNEAIIDRLKCRESFCGNYPLMCDPLSKKLDYFQNLNNNPSAIEENILLNDGELFDFQLATRNHLKKMFATDYEIRVLVEKFHKRDNIMLREMNFPNLIGNDINISCTDANFKDLVRRDLEWQYRNSQLLVSMCQLKRLVLDFLPIDKLGQILKELNSDLIKNDYVLALSSIAQFYTMPLVECVMSQHMILAGLHVPLLRTELQGLHMMKVLTPAYAWENYTCSANIPVLNVALLKNNSQWKVFVPKCDPVREDLCYISDYSNEENLGIACVQQTLRGGSFKQFSINCPISCHETGIDVQYMTPINSHRLVITHPTPTLRLKCRNFTENIKKEENIGTLSIAVPCNCRLEDEDHSIYPTYACVDKSIKFSQHYQIPAAWTRYSGLTLPKWGDPPLHFDKLTDCWDQHWITYQFPDDKIPTTTYFLIFLSILILISLTLSSYLIYKSRTSFEHGIQRTSQRTFTRVPIPIIDPRRRPLPQPIEEMELEETENEYLQPRPTNLQTQRPPTPMPTSPTTPPTVQAYVPRPDVQASTSGTQREPGYVKMDKLRAMFYAKNQTQ